MCGVTGMESQMTQHVERKSAALRQQSLFDSNTFALSSEHIFEADILPKVHPVHYVRAKVSVKRYLQSQNYKFASEVDLGGRLSEIRKRSFQ